MSPIVSVILPCYNRKNTIRASVLSVLTQSFTDLELIVVDDGSREDIKSVLDTIDDPRLRYIRRAKNGGAAAARNTGIAAAQGEFIGFQDSDDIWLPDRLEWQMGLFAQLPQEFGIVTSHKILYGRDDNFVMGSEKACVIPSLRTPPRNGDMVGAMLTENRLCLPCGLFRRNVWPSADWFDTCAKANEDWEFAVRISQRTRIYEGDRSVMLGFISPDSISGSRRKQTIGTLRVMRNNRALMKDYPLQYSAMLLDVGRTLAKSNKRRMARKFVLASILMHPAGILMILDSLRRRIGRSAGEMRLAWGLAK